MFTIIPFRQEYRDDTIYCFLMAKGALGRVPRLNDDMLDIQACYFGKDDMFWIALDETDRVIGMVGTDTVSESEMWLKRLFIKPELKRMGLGSALLSVAEDFARSKGIKVIRTRFPDAFVDASAFYPAKGFVDAERVNELRHMVKYI